MTGILEVYIDLVEMKWGQDQDINNVCNLLDYNIPNCEIAKSLANVKHYQNSDGEYVRNAFDLVLYLCISVIGATLIMSGLS